MDRLHFVLVTIAVYSLTLIAWAHETELAHQEARIVESFGPLVKRVELDNDGRVVSLKLVGGNVVDTHLARLKGLTRLKDLGLSRFERFVNVRVVDIEAPRRVRLRDDFSVVGIVQASGLNGQIVEFELVSTIVGQEATNARVLDRQSIRLGQDGESTQLRFQVPTDDVGRFNYILRAKPPKGDLFQTDDQIAAVVEVTDRNTRVLLLASGPTREFRFLQSQLFRDPGIDVDVLLQSGKPGISQSADELLTEFPENREKLSRYDCIIAFDPDWLSLNKQNVEMLAEWVGEHSGGFILISGPIHMPKLLQRKVDDRIAQIVRRLLPVVLPVGGNFVKRKLLDNPKSACPIQLTREGLRKEFLLLADDTFESEAVWGEFDGVFGQPWSSRAKPGATIYAYLENSLDDDRPIFLAGQFYGSGWVFYQSSGEIWRMRSNGVENFERYYQNLIQRAPHSRMSQGSRRGLLLVDRERYTIGEQVQLHAVLKNDQFEPLDVDEVEADVNQSNGESRRITLKPARKRGVYEGKFKLLKAGNHKIKLRIPSEFDEEWLSIIVRAAIPLKPFGDEGLAHLVKLANLETLNLSGAIVTDAGLVHLRGLKKLRVLDLRGTRVTQDGINSLEGVLPKIRIER